MTNVQKTKTYSPMEEKLNVASGALGLALSIIAFGFIVVRINLHESIYHMVSFYIFGASLMLSYAASTCYHSAKKYKLRNLLQTIDHSSIYILIAGTYTPYALITLKKTIGWDIFYISWGLALAGILFKIFFTGRFKVISTIMYVLMGWIIVFAINPLIQNLSFSGLLWLMAGGVSYTIGAVLYSIKKVKFNHAIFHMLVLLGSFCHFMSIFFHV